MGAGVGVTTPRQCWARRRILTPNSAFGNFDVILDSALLHHNDHTLFSAMFHSRSNEVANVNLAVSGDGGDLEDFGGDGNGCSEYECCLDVAESVRIDTRPRFRYWWGWRNPRHRVDREPGRHQHLARHREPRIPIIVKRRGQAITVLRRALREDEGCLGSWLWGRLVGAGLGGSVPEGVLILDGDGDFSR